MVVFDFDIVSNFCEKHFDRFVYFAAIFGTNFSFGVNDVDRRPTFDIPLLGNRDLAAFVLEASPRKIFLFDRLSDFLKIFVAIDTNQCEWFVGQLFYERPLVWVHRPAWWSPIPPKVEKNDLAAIIA